MKAPLRFATLAHRLWRHKGLASTALLPLSWAVGAFVAHKQHRFSGPENQARSVRPVVVVGNIYVGGTGKTPVVIALVQALQLRGWTPGVISRGYGATAGNAPQVGHGQLDPGLFGDEPTLIAADTNAPVCVHPQRVKALRQLEQTHPEVDIIVADDGLQHLALARDIEILVQDARGTGNGRLLPAGPLREPASKLNGVDYIITNLQACQPEPESSGSPARQISMCLLPVRMQHLESGRTDSWQAWFHEHEQCRVDALAGIGQPERFFDMLRHCGIKVGQTLSLPDHTAFQAPSLSTFGSNIILITAKDAVKCTGLNDPRIWVVHVAPQFSDPSWLDDIALRARRIARQKDAVPEHTRNASAGQGTA